MMIESDAQFKASGVSVTASGNDRLSRRPRGQSRVAQPDVSKFG